MMIKPKICISCKGEIVPYPNAQYVSVSYRININTYHSSRPPVEGEELAEIILCPKCFLINAGKEYANELQQDFYHNGNERYRGYTLFDPRVQTYVVYRDDYDTKKFFGTI